MIEISAGDRRRIPAPSAEGHRTVLPQNPIYSTLHMSGVGGPRHADRGADAASTGHSTLV